jgi:hypothetical protein
MLGSIDPDATVNNPNGIGMNLVRIRIIMRRRDNK